MSHQGFDGAIGSHVASGKVFKRVWELQRSSENRTRQHRISNADLQVGNKQHGCIDGELVALVIIWIHYQRTSTQATIL